jgi:hypothetical protein
MSFSSGQRRVKVWAGFSYNLLDAFTIVFTAFNAQGEQVDQARTDFIPEDPPRSRPIRTPLEVVAPAENIFRATVSLRAGGEDYIMNDLAIDDVEFESQSAPLACAAKNGDINADGNADLSDAVTILGNLFLGSPADLVGLCAGPPAASGLPDTGQTECYGLDPNQIWRRVPCAETACKGQDGAHATGCPPEGRFTDNGDGTVTDHCTGLMWQKDTADVNGDGQLSQDFDSGDLVPWCDALAYCENLSFAGHDDWRLPNVRELESIVNYGRFDSKIDPVFDGFQACYWSSTSDAGSPVSAWYVSFGGNVSISGPCSKADPIRCGTYVRAVRNVQSAPLACAAKNGDVNADGNVDLSDAVTILGNLFLGNPAEFVGLCAGPPAASGLPDTEQTECYSLDPNPVWDGLDLNQFWIKVPCAEAACKGQDGAYTTGCPPQGRFTDNGDGTVTDHCTGLMWQKDTADTNADGQVPNDRSDALPWCEALNYCENLSFAGHDDWRLPNVRELLSIYDYGRSDSTIMMDPVFGAFRGFYWSSTSDVRSPIFAWYVSFGLTLESGSLDFKADPSYIRAVRSGP